MYCTSEHFYLSSPTALVVLLPSYFKLIWKKTLCLCFPGEKQNCLFVYYKISDVFLSTKKSNKSLYTIKNKNHSFAYKSRRFWVCGENKWLENIVALLKNIRIPNLGNVCPKIDLTLKICHVHLQVHLYTNLYRKIPERKELSGSISFKYCAGKYLRFFCFNNHHSRKKENG